jgi:hypothetical protein
MDNGNLVSRSMYRATRLVARGTFDQRVRTAAATPLKAPAPTCRAHAALGIEIAAHWMPRTGISPDEREVVVERVQERSDVVMLGLRER